MVEYGVNLASPYNSPATSGNMKVAYLCNLRDPFMNRSLPEAIFLGKLENKFVVYTSVHGALALIIGAKLGLTYLA